MPSSPSPAPEVDARPSANRLQRILPFLPAIVFAVSLLLRLWGIGWGLPNDQRHWSYHPDEPILYLYSQQVEPAKLDFEPGFYNYGTLYLTVLRVAGDIAKTYGGGDQQWQQMGSAHLAGRLMSASAGAGTVLVLFLLLRRRLGDIGALAGALVPAFAPGFVVHSRFQTVDVLATFLLAISALFALKLLPAEDVGDLDPQPALKASIWSGVFTGLSAGTKYTGLLGLLTLAAAIFFSSRSDKPKLAGAGFVSALVAFILSTPGILLNTSKFWQDFTYEMRHTSEGHGVVFAGLPSGFVWHLYNLLVGVGPILVFLGVVGMAWAAWKKDRAAIALGAFFIAYYILIGRAEVLFLRYTFPLLIGLGFGLGWAVRQTWNRPGWARAVPALAIVGLGGLFGGGLASSAVDSSFMANPDPRDEAAAYLRTANAQGVGVVSDPWFYTPPLYPEAGAWRVAPFEQRYAAMIAAENPRVIQAIPQGDPSQRYDWNTDLLDLAPPYIVFSSFETEGLDRLRNRTHVQGTEKLFRDRFVAFTDRLVKEYELDRRFGGFPAQDQTRPSGIHDLDYIRPLIWVWKRK